MKKTLRWIPTALALVLVGCKTSPPPAPPAPASSARRVTTLSQALDFSEDLKGSKRLPITNESHLVDLDYKSRLTITPRREDLESLSAPEGPVLPPLSRQEEVRLQQVSELIRVASNYVHEASRLNEELRQFRANNGRAADQIEILQRAIREQGRTGTNLVEQVIEIARASAKARLGANVDPDQVNREIKRLTDPLLVDSKGNEVALNVEAFAKFLTEEMRFGITLASNDTAVVEQRGTTRFRLRAWVVSRGKEPLAAHVENYDNIEDPMPAKDPRVSFRMNDEERERVSRGYKVAEDAARLIRDLKSNESSLRQGLSGLLQTTRSDLTKLKNDFRKIDPATSPLIPPALTSVLSNALAIVTNSAAVDDATKRFVTPLLSELDNTSQQRSNVLLLIQMIDQPSSQDLFTTFSAVSDSLNSLGSALINLPGLLQTNLNRLSALAQAVGKVEGPEAAALATSLAQNLLPETTRKATELIALFKESYPNLAAELGRLVAGAPVLTMAAEVNAAGLDPRVRTLTLDRVVPATVNLDNLPGDRGDKLRIKAELIIPTGEQEQIIENDRTFSIDRFGWTSRFAAHLAFVDREGSDESFVPAPSVSWTVHYRLREREQLGFGRKLWSFMDPGVGLNVAALNFDNNFEVGVGPHVTFFNDLIQCGYGYNLNVSTDHGYLFVGIGILEALEGVGSLFHRARSDAPSP